jgi:hypothetical protein
MVGWTTDLYVLGRGSPSGVQCLDSKARFLGTHQLYKYPMDEASDVF